VEYLKGSVRVWVNTYDSSMLNDIKKSNKNNTLHLQEDVIMVSRAKIMPTKF